MLFECHECANAGTLAKFETADDLKYHIQTHLNTLMEKSLEHSWKKNRQINNDIWSSSRGIRKVNEVGKTTAARSNATSQAIGQTNLVTTVNSKDPACSTSSAINSVVKPTDLNCMDTSEVEVLGEVHWKNTRKRQHQPSNLVCKSEPEEVQETSEEDIVIVGYKAAYKEAGPKTIPAKQKATLLEEIVIVGYKEAGPITIPAKDNVTLLEKEADKRPNSAPKHPRTMSTEEAEAQVSAGALGTQFQTTNIMPESLKKSGKGSVIMKMMKKMGYVHGKGLGVKKQGIVEPILAKRNRGRAGVGVSKSRGPTTMSCNGLASNSSQTMPKLSPTCVTVKPFGLNSTQLQKYTNYLLNYFGIFGRIEKINFDAKGANITFKDPAFADLCLQQDEHIIDGIDCEVTRAEASIPKVSIPKVPIPKVPIPTLSSHIRRPLPPPAQTENTDFSQTRVSVQGIRSKLTRLQKKSFPIYFGKFGTVEKVDGEIITFKNSASADLCVQQKQHLISGINCQVTRIKASKNERKKMREALQKKLPAQKNVPAKKNVPIQKKLPSLLYTSGPSRGSGHATGVVSTNMAKTTVNRNKNLPTPAVQPGSSRGTTQAISNLSPSGVHSITVTGICLDSTLTVSETKAFYTPYFTQFGIVTSVKRISDSEATVVFQNFSALENALRAGTVKFDGKDCKITRSAASTSTELGGKSQEKAVPILQNQSGASNRSAQNPRPLFQSQLPAPHQYGAGVLRTHTRVFRFKHPFSSATTCRIRFLSTAEILLIRISIVMAHPQLMDNLGDSHTRLERTLVPHTQIVHCHTIQLFRRTIKLHTTDLRYFLSTGLLLIQILMAIKLLDSRPAIWLPDRRYTIRLLDHRQATVIRYTAVNVVETTINFSH